MVSQPEMTSNNSGVGCRPRSIIMMKGLVLVFYLVICLIMLSIVNLRTADAANCDCAVCHGTAINYHGNGTSSPGNAWASCSTCHGAPPATGAHLLHSSPISNSTYGDTITSTADEYRFGCGHCHPLDYSRHNNGTKDIELYNPNPVATGRTGTQVCSDCHGSNGPHGTSCDFNDCTSCHTDKSMLSLAHPISTQTPTACTTCHTTQHVSPINVDVACGQCHGGPAGENATTHGAPYLSSTALAMYASVIHQGVPEGGPVSPDPVLPPGPGCDSALKASGTLTGGVCTTDGSLLTTCSTTLGSASTLTGPFSNQAGNTYIDWGDGSAIETNPTSPANHTYSHMGKYQVTQTVTNPCGFRSRKHYIVNVTSGGNGKGTITISADATYPFSYNIYYANGQVSITSASVGVGTARKAILDAGNYDVKVTYPSGQPTTSGTCTGSPVPTTCKSDSDCPMNYSVTPAVHYSCSALSTPRACDWAITAPGSGTCTVNGCEDVVLPSNTIVEMVGTNCND